MDAIREHARNVAGFDGGKELLLVPDAPAGVVDGRRCRSRVGPAGEDGAEFKRRPSGTFQRGDRDRRPFWDEFCPGVETRDAEIPLEEFADGVHHTAGQAARESQRLAVRPDRPGFGWQCRIGDDPHDGRAGGGFLGDGKFGRRHLLDRLGEPRGGRADFDGRLLANHDRGQRASVGDQRHRTPRSGFVRLRRARSDERKQSTDRQGSGKQ